MSDSKLMTEASLQYLSEGISLHEAGKTSDAIQVLRNALDIDPENYLAAYLLGICYRDLGNHAAAMQFLKQAHTIDPTHAESTQALGLLYVDQGDINEGVSLLKTYLQSAPGDVITLRALGLAYARQRDYLRGLKYLEQAFQAMSQDSVLKLEYGLALSRANQPEKAKIVLAELAAENPSARALTELAVLDRDTDKNSEEALDKLKQAVFLDPNYVRAQRQIGVTHLISGNSDKAVLAFKLATEKEPESVLNWRWLAHAYQDSGELILAHNALLEATKHNPDISVLWFDLAQLARSSRDNFKAQDYIKKALALTPGQPEVIVLSLMIDLDAGQTDRVYQVVDKILDENPDLADAVSSLAIRAYQQNDIDVTKRLFELVIEKTGSPRAINNLGYLLIGMEEYKEAEIQFKIALERNFGNPELTYINLGYLDIRKGDPVSAENHLLKAKELIENYPSDHTAILRVASMTVEKEYVLLHEGDISPSVAIQGNLATALAAQGKLDEALETAKKSVAGDQSPAVGYLVLASIYKLLGHTDEATAAMQKAQELFESTRQDK